VFVHSGLKRVAQGKGLTFYVYTDQIFPEDLTDVSVLTEADRTSLLYVLDQANSYIESKSPSLGCDMVFAEGRHPSTTDSAKLSLRASSIDRFWNDNRERNQKVRVFTADKYIKATEDLKNDKLKSEWEKYNRRVEIEIIPKFSDLAHAYSRN
jgi:hypothetical protein